MKGKKGTRRKLAVLMSIVLMVGSMMYMPNEVRGYDPPSGTFPNATYPYSGPTGSLVLMGINGWSYSIKSASGTSIYFGGGKSFDDGPRFALFKTNFVNGGEFTVKSPVYTISSTGNYNIRLVNNEKGDTNTSYMEVYKANGTKLYQTDNYGPISPSVPARYELTNKPFEAGDQIYILYVQDYSAQGTKAISAEIVRSDQDVTGAQPTTVEPSTESPIVSGYCGSTANGAAGTNLSWSFNENTGVLNITGSGAMEEWTRRGNVPWYDYRNIISSVVLPNGLTTIGNYAFDSCRNITGITLPNSVTTIGQYAFYYCTRLMGITIPNNVTTIGLDAFSHCIGLTGITIPNSVTTIENGAFSGCTGLTGITVPSSVTSMGTSVFSGCTGLTSVSLPNNTTSISGYEFYGCRGLTSFTIPSNVTSIGDDAFSSCSGLTEIIIPESVSTIGNTAFDSCSNMTDIYIYNANCSIYTRAGTIYSGTVIHGYTGSTAESYATTYNRTFVPLDGQTTVQPTTVQPTTVQPTTVQPTTVQPTTVQPTTVQPTTSEWTAVPGYTKTVAGASGGEAQNPPAGAVVEHGVWRLWDMNADASSGSQVNYNGAISYKGSGTTVQNLTLRIDEPVIFTGGNDGANPIGIATTFQLSNTTTYEYTVRYTSTNAGGAAIHLGSNNSSTVHRCPTVYHQVEAGENVVKGFIRINHQNDGTEGAVKFCFYPSDGTAALPAGTQVHFTEISFRPLSEISDTTLSGQIGNNMHWSLNRTTGAMVITGSGRHSFSSFGAPWYVINGLIRSVTLSGGITTITNCAFNECSKIESITIPNSVTRIECNAFYACGSLTSITVPESVTNIEWRGIFGCSSLTDVYIYNRNCNINNSAATIDSQATIHGYTGSTAESYATTYNRTFVPLDVTTTEEPTTNDGWTPVPSSGTGSQYVAIYNTGTPTVIGAWKLYVQQGKGAMSYQGNGATTGDMKLRIDEAAGANGGYWGLCARTQYHMDAGKTYRYTVRFTSTNAGTAYTELQYRNDAPEWPNEDRLQTIVVGENVWTGTVECPYTYDYNYTFMPTGSLPAGTIIDFEEVKIEEVVAETTTEEPTTNTSTPEADFKIASKTLALSSGISLVFKVNKSLFENRYSEPKIVVLLDGFETEITEYTDEGSRYAFEFTKITPDKMNVMVEATLHATKNGKDYVSPVTEYSVATYVYNMLNKYGETPGMETFRTLLVDLLNYGAASQNYTNFNTDNPANADLTATQRSWATASVGNLISVKNNKYQTIASPSVLWKSAGLALQDAVIVKMKIQADSTDGLVVRVTDDYGTTWNIEPEDFEPAAGTVNQYYISFKGFNVGRMSDSMYFTVYRNGVVVSNTYRYSVESYVLQYMNNGDSLGALVTAMMKYGKSAQAYSS